MYKTLIVDDEPIVKIALRSIINWESHGFTVCGTASDGTEAIVLTKTHSPELIITDLKMPNMDGLELIKTLKETHYTGEILVISNYGDFDYVRSALVMGAADYILKVNIQEETLLPYLVKIKEKLDQQKSSHEIEEKQIQMKEKIDFHQLLKQFLENQTDATTADTSQIETANKNYAFMTPLQRFSSTSFSLCFFSFEQYSMSQPSSFSGNLIESTLEEAFASINGVDILFLNQYTVLVFLPTASLEQRGIPLTVLIGQLPSLFQLYLSVSPLIIYQEQVVGAERLKEWYLIFQNIIKLRFYEELSILCASDYMPVHYINFIYYKEFASSLQKKKDIGIEEINMAINEVLDQCQLRHIYPEIVKVFFEKSIELLEYMEHNVSLETHEFLMEARETIRNSSSVMELKNHVLLSIETILYPVEPQAVETINTKYEILQAIDFIKKNYNKKIGLFNIAEEVNISASYLCRLFKSEVGMSVTNYINQLRMEKAGELIRLGSPNTYMKEISTAVGIEDQLYFSRVFKKYFGMTPSEYRQGDKP